MLAKAVVMTEQQLAGVSMDAGMGADMGISVGEGGSSTSTAELSSEGEESEAEVEAEAEAEHVLTYQTVKVYVSAIAELYHWQVSSGTNLSPSFRGPALKGLLKDLERTQDQRSRKTFADR